MKISELIEHLNKIQNQYGDLDVRTKQYRKIKNKNVLFYGNISGIECKHVKFLDNDLNDVYYVIIKE